MLRRRPWSWFLAALIGGAPGISPALAGAPGDGGETACFDALDQLGVRYERADRPGIAIGVKVQGTVGGVTYDAYDGSDLVLDCSLVYSLARAGDVLREYGIERAVYSGSYQRRTIRNTGRTSSHSFGLALDVHIYEGESLDRLRIEDDYEQGLGSADDCLGRPLTEGGAILRDLHCRLENAQLFRFILSPDYDAHHFNHFHLEAHPWTERDDLHPDHRD